MILTGDLPSADDIAVIKKQIHSEKVDPYSVPIRCSYGFPMLIVLKINSSGKLDYSNLANPIWLTCPYLNNKIHNIENKGYIAKITAFMESDRVMKTHMHDAHAEFYFMRKKMYHRQFNTPYPVELTDRFNLGIGGIQDIKHIKCLHLHFGHFLICANNKVGYMTKLLLNNKIYCDDGRCACLKN